MGVRETQRFCEDNFGKFGLLLVTTLSETDISPENRPGPKRKVASIPTIHFQGAKMLVSGRRVVVFLLHSLGKFLTFQLSHEMIYIGLHVDPSLVAIVSPSVFFVHISGCLLGEMVMEDYPD